MKIKKIAVIVGVSALTFATAGFAANHNTVSASDNPNTTSGPFLGANIGLARAYYGDLDKALREGSTSEHQGGFAAGVFGGYHINQYLDGELGYLYLPTNKYSFGEGEIKLKTQAVYGLAKAYLPLALVNESLSPLSLYGEGGVAYVMSKMTGSVPGLSFDLGHKNSWEPMYGAGVAYSVNQNAVINIGWTQIYGPKVKTSDNSLKSPLVNVASIGFTYRFVNL